VRCNAARASSRVESSVGSGEFTSFMISGISVQPSTTASQPSSSFMRWMTLRNAVTASGVKTPQTSSSMMMRLISSRSSAVGRTYSSPLAESFSG
jgi:hypothetical protein